MIADAWLDASVWEDVITSEEATAATALRAHFRRFSCPSWRRIGRRIVEVYHVGAHVADAPLAIGEVVSPLPSDLRESLVDWLASTLVAAYEDLYNSRIGHA